MEELVILEHLEAFKRNGFQFAVDEAAGPMQRLKVGFGFIGLWVGLVCVGGLGRWVGGWYYVCIYVKDEKKR
jgi:hypothetical protein